MNHFKQNKIQSQYLRLTIVFLIVKLFFTFDIMAEKNFYVNDLNGMEVWSDKELTNKEYLKYKEEFQFIKEENLEEIEKLSNKRLKKINYKEKIYYFQKTKNPKYTSFEISETPKFLYTSKSIPFYLEPFLDSEKVGILDKFKMVEVHSFTPNKFIFKIKYKNQIYSIFNTSSTIVFGEKEYLEDNLIFKKIINPYQVMILKNKKPKYIEIEDKKVKPVQFKKKNIYIIGDEITWKQKKYYNLVKEKNNLFIEKEDHIIYSESEFSEYTFRKSKNNWKYTLYELFKENNIHEGVDYRSIKLKQLNLKNKNTKYYSLNYNSICTYDCHSEAVFNKKSLLVTKIKNKFKIIIKTDSQGLSILDLDKDNIPEFIIEDYHLRGGLQSIFLTFDKNGKKKMKVFVDPYEVKITKNGFYIYYYDYSDNKKKLVIWGKYVFKKGILYEKRMDEVNSKWEILKLVDKFQ